MFSTNLSYDHRTPCSEKSRKFWMLKYDKIEIDCFSGFGNHSSNFHLKIFDTINTFLYELPKQMFSISWTGVFVTSPFCMFPDFWTFDLVFRKNMVVQLHHMAFINKNIAPEGWTFAPLISVSSVVTPLFYFISGVYIYSASSIIRTSIIRTPNLGHYFFIPDAQLATVSWNVASSSGLNVLQFKTR